MNLNQTDEISSITRLHLTQGGKTEDFRAQFYRQIECRQIDGLVEMYKMDLEVFGYDTSLFYELCRNKSESIDDNKR